MYWGILNYHPKNKRTHTRLLSVVISNVGYYSPVIIDSLFKNLIPRFCFTLDVHTSILSCYKDGAFWHFFLVLSLTDSPSHGFCSSILLAKDKSPVICLFPFNFKEHLNIHRFIVNEMFGQLNSKICAEIDF